MNFISNDPDHIEVLESKATAATNSTTEAYEFNGKVNC